MRKNPASPLAKVVSGGQTGADRAGLAAAFALGIPTGGWVTRGARSEDNGLTPETLHLYGLKEIDSYDYRRRTEMNVMDSDGTVIFGDLTSSGSRLTRNFCLFHHKPMLVHPTPASLALWVLDNQIKTLNVAGNRESVNPGIFQHVFDNLINAFGIPG